MQEGSASAGGRLKVRSGPMQDRETGAVGDTLAFLNPGNRLEPVVRGNHQRFRFGVPLLRREGCAKEALRLRDAPIAWRIQFRARAQCGTE